MRGLDGKRALVTGAARGIGLATAERLGREGARVALLDVDAAALDEALAAAGDGALAIHADVRDEDAVRAAVDGAVARWGGLDVVVANAAIQLSGSDDRADRLDRDVWQATLDVNLTGAFLTAKHGARALLECGGGAIVCVGSPAGAFGIARGMQAYAASKAGLLGLTKSIARELASRGITVNAVAPGFIETDMTAALTPEQRDLLSKQIPLERLGSPEDIAKAVLFLASDDASYITGQVLVVDGGMVMQ
jgi:3-oxoacyl-[acyl-carrier protein] reductase